MKTQIFFMLLKHSLITKEVQFNRLNIIRECYKFSYTYFIPADKKKLTFNFIPVEHLHMGATLFFKRGQTKTVEEMKNLILVGLCNKVKIQLGRKSVCHSCGCDCERRLVNAFVFGRVHVAWRGAVSLSHTFLLFFLF